MRVSVSGMGKECKTDNIAVGPDQDDRTPAFVLDMRIRGVEPEGEVLQPLVGVVLGLAHVEAEAVDALLLVRDESELNNDVPSATRTRPRTVIKR